MIKEIKYNGFSETPSDYESPDGDLASSLNLVNEDEAISPVFSPSQLFTLDDGDKVAYIHVNTNYEHYIIQSGKSLYWFDGSIIPAPSPFHFSTTQNSSKLIATLDSDILKVKSIGNVLVVLTAKGLHHILWKDNNYKNLGAHIPELEIQFSLTNGSLVSDFRHSSKIELKGDYPRNEATNYIHVTQPTPLTEEDQKVVTQPVLAIVNKAVQELMTKGEFLFPFFVRYAYRLYDGNTVMASAPILMTPSYDVCPFTPYTYEGDEFIFQKGGNGRLLNYYISNAQQLNDLSNWSDIVTGVAVFISLPIYNYDQSGMCEYLVPKDYYERYTPLEQGSVLLGLPMFKDDNSFNAKITSCSNFYLLQEYSISELKYGSVVQMKVTEGLITSLAAREKLVDDYQTHDTLISRYAFNYNSRLNLANISRKLFQGFTPELCNKKMISNDYNIAYRAYIHINSDQGVIVTQVDESVYYMDSTAFPYWYYYPDARAFKVVLVGLYVGLNNQDPDNDKRIVYELPLTQHDFLNGAYYFSFDKPSPVFTYTGGDYHLEDEVPESCKPLYETNTTVFLPNKIYTSEVNNPFYFPTLGINTVGTGNILGICAAVKALSQGQFGQFPLYAFTDEGVWALEVSSEGKYTAKQPVTRDVCINNNSITQIDTAVLFATDRGIMLIQGANSQCISDILNSNHSFSVDDLPNLKSILGNEVASQLDFIPFSDFIKNCRMLYDYTHQRIFVYNAAQSYSYVYSLKSKKWGIVHSNIQESINSYPNALALCLKQVAEGITTNTVVDFSVDDDAIENMQCVLVTRPLKLDAPDLLKTVGVIIQRGQFRHGSVKTILYGSRDLFNWHYIYSSNDHYLRGFSGTPYKYFRVVLICDLKHDESIFGCTVSFTPRFIDQPR